MPYNVRAVCGKLKGKLVKKKVQTARSKLVNNLHGKAARPKSEVSSSTVLT